MIYELQIPFLIKLLKRCVCVCVKIELGKFVKRQKAKVKEWINQSCCFWTWDESMQYKGLPRPSWYLRPTKFINKNNIPQYFGWIFSLHFLISNYIAVTKYGVSLVISVFDSWHEFVVIKWINSFIKVKVIILLANLIMISLLFINL